MQQDQDMEVVRKLYLEYTYYRHSAPKEVIYYRCSDRRCPARLHYDTVNKEIILKNNHLSPAVHRPSNSKRAITTQQLLKMPNHRMRAPVVVSQSMPSQKLKCDEDFNLPKKRERYITLVNGISQEVYLIRFSVDNIDGGMQFAKDVMEKCVGNKVSCFKSGLSFATITAEEEGVLIEVETTQERVSKVVQLMNQFFGNDVDADIFKKV